MLRASIFFIFLGIIICLSLSCSPISEFTSITNKASQAGQVNYNVNKRNDPVEKQLGNTDEKDIKEIIQDHSQKIGILPLIKDKQSNEFEFRLWINLGMPSDEKLLIVRADKGSDSGFLYHFPIEADSRNQPTKEDLAKPKDGWKKLRSELSNRLETPKRLAFFPQINISNHEGVIVSEVLEKGDYQFVFYGQHSTFEDAVRLQEVCEYLSSEFHLNLDCRGQHTKLRPIGK